MVGEEEAKKGNERKKNREERRKGIEAKEKGNVRGIWVRKARKG